MTLHTWKCASSCATLLLKFLLLGRGFEDNKQNIYEYQGIISFITLYLTQHGLDVSEGKTPKITQPRPSHITKTGKFSLGRTIYIYFKQHIYICTKTWKAF